MNKHKTKRFLVVVGIMAAISLFGIHTAYGLAQVTLTVKNPNPYEGNYSWFVYTNNPGETIEDVATVKNFSNEPAEVSVYAVDASSNQSGSFILSFLHDDQSGIGAWTDVSMKTLTIPPFEIIDVPFSITVPDDITPGQYLGGIVVENGGGAADEAVNGNATSVSVKTRIGSRVYLTVPGEVVEDIQLTDFSAKKELSGQTKFYLTIENNGNMAYEPTVKINVYTQTGRLYETIEENLGTISSNSIIKPVITMEKRPFAGSFSAKADIQVKCKFAPANYRGSAHTLSGETSFWAIPWELVLGTLFIIFIVLTVITNRKLARKKYFANSEEYIVQTNEDLVSIGKSRNVSWRKIARYNKLKPPFIVRQGKKLIVPKNQPKQQG